MRSSASLAASAAIIGLLAVPALAQDDGLKPPPPKLAPAAAPAPSSFSLSIVKGDGKPESVSVKPDGEMVYVASGEDPRYPAGTYKGTLTADERKQLEEALAPLPALRAPTAEETVFPPNYHRITLDYTDPRGEPHHLVTNMTFYLHHKSAAPIVAFTSVARRLVPLPPAKLEVIGSLSFDVTATGDVAWTGFRGAPDGRRTGIFKGQPTADERKRLAAALDKLRTLPVPQAEDKTFLLGEPKYLLEWVDAQGKKQSHVVNLSYLGKNKSTVLPFSDLADSIGERLNPPTKTPGVLGKLEKR
ncbi:MAG: hypothetical protein ACAI25_05230 [Planctomycetota bacterium]